MNKRIQVILGLFSIFLLVNCTSTGGERTRQTFRKIGPTKIETSSPSDFVSWGEDEVRVSYRQLHRDNGPWVGTTSSKSEDEHEVNAEFQNNLNLFATQANYDIYLNKHVDRGVFIHGYSTIGKRGTKYFSATQLGVSKPIKNGKMVVVPDFSVGLKDNLVIASVKSKVLETESQGCVLFILCSDETIVDDTTTSSIQSNDLSPFFNIGVNLYLDYGIRPYISTRIESVFDENDLGATNYFFTLNGGINIPISKSVGFIASVSSITNSIDHKQNSIGSNFAFRWFIPPETFE